MTAALAVSLTLRIDDEDDVARLGEALGEPGVHLVVRLEARRERDGGIPLRRIERGVEPGAELRAVAVDEGELEIGQVSALIKTIQPAAEIVQDIYQEYEQALKQPVK